MPHDTGVVAASLFRRSEVQAKIIVADDDDAIRTILSKTVQALGHSVTEVKNGQQVLDTLALDPDAHALIVLDAMMPEMSGFEVCEAVRKKYSATRVPILFVTAMDDRAARLRAHTLGADEFLTKPIDRIEFITRIDHLLKLRDYEALQRSNAELLQDEVERLTQTLIRVERLAFLGTLAGGVGHELNNITTVFGTALYLMRQDPAGPKVDPETLEMLDSVLEHLRLHGQSLLELGRPGPDHEDEVDLAIVVAQTIRTLRLTGRTKLMKVVEEFPSTPLLVTINRSRLEQVFLNLIGNAADAIVDGNTRNGRIDIVLGQSAEGAATVEVRDNGCGIDRAQRDRVFSPYYTTKAEGRGTGLGLVVVKQIVTQYGGTIELESAPQKGTTLRLTFPLSHPPETENAHI